MLWELLFQHFTIPDTFSLTLKMIFFPVIFLTPAHFLRFLPVALVKRLLERLRCRLHLLYSSCFLGNLSVQWRCRLHLLYSSCILGNLSVQWIDSIRDLEFPADLSQQFEFSFSFSAQQLGKRSLEGVSWFPPVKFNSFSSGFVRKRSWGRQRRIVRWVV